MFTVLKKGGRFNALLLNADVVVERHASKSLTDRALRGTELKPRPVRAPHLTQVERELAELKQVVAALAVRSVAHEENAASFDSEGMTVLDAETAHDLLDSPPAPTDALRDLFALR